MNHCFICTISPVRRGNVRQTDKQTHSLSRNIMPVISLAALEDFGSFRHLPQETHYPSRIYILFNICQTFINYALMKCSTVLGDGANEDRDFWLLSDAPLFDSNVRALDHALLTIITLVSGHVATSGSPAGGGHATGHKWPPSITAMAYKVLNVWHIIP